ncbi:c-type cytochrome [Nitratireductor sp. GCM10026969]|uniref:c-type cytochrome n=1 Tax=Nitratireductor sp. GCM10026969 TaxID=3252645 RepID=UPI00360C8A62
MRWISLPGWEALLFGVVIAVVGGLLLGGIFVLSGVYNVGAAVRHFDATNAVIRLTLRRSVETHSFGVGDPPDLSEEALARLGARHFALGCAPCHASPAATQNPVAAEMYPAPPPLSRAVEHWETKELFWIVDNGLKFTGMPAWPGRERVEEVWALVAFLERLPEMDAETYAEMTGLDTQEIAGATRFEFGQDLETADVAAMCDTCHGAPGAAPVHPLAARLSGQKPEYMERALVEYSQNRRQSGIMETVASELGEGQMEALARRYAERESEPILSPGALDPEAVRRGQTIALRGAPEGNVPACLSCHSTATSGQFPRLDGLPAEYIATQLSLFSSGVRSGTVYADIMAPVADRLSQQQIEDVAAYFASLGTSGGAAETSAREAAR